MAFLSPPLLPYVEHFEHKKLIHSTESCRIDHRAILLTIDYLNFKPGKGDFRVPQNIIENLDYGKDMVTTIRRTINEHTLNPQPDWSLHEWTTKMHYSRLSDDKNTRSIDLELHTQNTKIPHKTE